jgi:TatD DNase family protein
VIDTHAHLDDERFAADLPAVLERAAAAGVARIVTVGTSAASSRACVNLAARFPSLVAAVGIHPNHVAEAAATDWDQIVNLTELASVRAIGETGLDRYRDFTPQALQQDYFVRHLELAWHRNLAVVIHCRQAEEDVLHLLRENYQRHGPVRGVMHSFSGDAATAAACLELGLYLSFAGMVTYQNAHSLRDVARDVALDRLLLETDSPYLAPVPVRGKRNEPAFVAHTAMVLARLHNVEVSALAEQTTRNARALFGMQE